MKHFKLLTSLPLLFAASFVFAGGGGGGGGGDIVYEDYSVPAPMMAPVMAAPVAAEPQVIQEPCNCPSGLSPWSNELFVYQCDFRNWTLTDNTALTEGHVNFGMMLFQKYNFNRSKINAYNDALNRGENVHPFDPQANTFGVYAAVDFFTRVFRINGNATSGARVDLNLGLSYQFRFFDKMLHALEVGPYYSIPVPGDWHHKGTGVNPAGWGMGVYAGLANYFSITRNFALGVRVAYKHGLYDTVDNIADTKVRDINLGLTLRWDYMI